MISTPAALLPGDETERLRTLHHYTILRSLQEEVFDELVALTARVFNLPIAYISLIDRDEASYKATHGFPLLPPQPRVGMLCAVTVRANQVVVYHDLAAATPTPVDAVALQRSLDNFARFYAGAPLRMPDQHSIGALCVVGPQPRSFSPDEQVVLERLAMVVALTIVVRHLCLQQYPHGADRWQAVQAELRDEVYALRALVRYLAARYGTAEPMPKDILHPVMRRLNDLRDILEEHRQG
jgi:GAF domain-containing protein